MRIARGMSYGLQLSASGVAAAMYRQDVFANNLANLNTVGFKADVPMARTREAVRDEDGIAHLPSNELLERLGGGVLMHRNLVSHAQGSIRPTSGAYDLALEGAGFFQVAGHTAGEAALTRDGRMVLNANGTLVTAASGRAVLDNEGNEVRLSRQARVSIDGNGAVRQGGGVVATLAVVEARDPQSIEKGGDGIFHAPSGQMRSIEPERRRVRQFAVEESGVNEITTMMEMTSASRTIDSNVALMQAHDRMMERAITSLGRVS